MSLEQNKISYLKCIMYLEIAPLCEYYARNDYITAFIVLLLVGDNLVFNLRRLFCNSLLHS